MSLRIRRLVALSSTISTRVPRIAAGVSSRRGESTTSTGTVTWKGAAGADFAFHPDPSAHQVHQLRTDRQAQACPAVLAGHRSVGLFKGLEDSRLFLRRNADARIGHGHVQCRVAVGLCFPARRSPRSRPLR